MGDLWCALFGHRWHRIAHWIVCKNCNAVLSYSAQIPEDIAICAWKGEK
jgi:hypothetical protein